MTTGTNTGGNTDLGNNTDNASNPCGNPSPLTFSNTSSAYAVNQSSEQLLYEGSFTLTETSDNCLWNTHSGSFNLTNFVELNSTVDGAMHHIEANVYEQDWTFIDSDWVDFCMENGGVCRVDSDGDGVFDNEDAFPDDASETMDSDMDGVGDNADAFPNDANETMDSDMDGVGDNADAFPNDANETMDSDMDGVGDNADEFPQDGTETLDTDGDGTGDNADTDDDDDGVGDNADEFPQDGNGNNGFRHGRCR